MRGHWVCCVFLAYSWSVAAQGAGGQPCAKKLQYDAATNSMKLVSCKNDVVGQEKVRPMQSNAPGTAAPPVAAPNTASPVAESNADYAIWVNNYTEQIYEGQKIYTLVIFIVTNTLVVAGLYFAWIQFKATLHLSQHLKSASLHMPILNSELAKPGIEEAAPPDSGQGESDDPGDGQAGGEKKADDEASQNGFSTTELKLGRDGVAISSSFIGLIILVVSMGFYFMYLNYVYPIRTAGTDNHVVSH